MLAVIVMILPCRIVAEGPVCYFTYTGTHNPEDPGSEVYAWQGSTSAEAVLWQNDTAYFKAVIESAEQTHVTVNTECDLPLDILVLDETLASLGAGENTGAPYVTVPEIVKETNTLEMAAGERRQFLIRAQVPAGTPAGTYDGTVTVETESGISTLAVHLQVVGLSLPEKNTLSLNLWQYPYAPLRYYACLQGEEPFSAKHREILLDEMRKYAELGGESITVTAVDEAWGHQTYDDYPAMIRWHKDNDGWMWFDYTQFDAWVSLCMEAGVDERIDTFSILPWSSAVTFDMEDGSKVNYPLSVGSQEWRDVWGTFLMDYMYHLNEKGWLDRTYIFIDERDIASVQAAVDLVRSLKLEDGRGLKLATAVNRIPRETELFDQIDYVSVSLAAVPENDPEFDTFLQHRHETGLETTMYTCSTNYPNSFAASDPAETVWTVHYLASRGFDGFLRWALDAWPADPLHTLDYRLFEAGDTLLFYPDEADADSPQARDSIRSLMLAQGMRDMRKVSYLLEHMPEGAEKTALQETAENIRRSYGNFNAWGAMYASGPDASVLICEENEAFRACVDQASLAIPAQAETVWKKNACE